MRSSPVKRSRKLDGILDAEHIAHGKDIGLRCYTGDDAGAYSMPAMPRLDRIAVHCDGVIDIVSALFNVSGREIRESGKKTLGVSRVRQIAMYVAHVTFSLSMRDVGIGFGRDRTTVLYACHLIEDMRDDEEFDRIVNMVERVVRVAFRHMDEE